ncbi:MAG: hypothetical protein AAFZ92_07305 [Pseudomonadota bacterium]
MSVWPIVFIALAIVMTVGPIMLMQPSKWDRHLARLRQQAAEQGLRVRLATYGKQENKNQSIAVYSLAATRPEDAVCWHLMKEPYAHDLHFHQHWQWSGHSPQLSDQMSLAIQACLDELPADVVGVELTQDSIGFWWRERGQWTVDMLRSNLEKFFAVLQ